MSSICFKHVSLWCLLINSHKGISTNSPLYFSSFTWVWFICVFIRTSSTFAMNNSSLLKSLVIWLKIVTKLLNCADHVPTWVRGFSIGVLTCLGEECFTTLKESCAPGGTGVKDFKYPLEALSEQQSMMEWCLFNTLWAVWPLVHFNCSNISSYWRVTLLELFSLLVHVLIFFKVS